MTRELGTPVDFKFDLGSLIKDKITGFQGIITTRSQWISNCNTYGVKPRNLDKDGAPMDVRWFDEPMVDLVEENVFKPVIRKAGGSEKVVPQTNR